MQYLISFLEGMITFISPCLLPLLPVYVSYFAGGGERSLGKTMRNAVGFVLGFSLVFMAMGALAGTVGGFLGQHRTAVNLISGVIVIIFGLNFLGVFRFQLFRGGARSLGTKELGFFSSMLFGAIFSIGWTPCVGVFLGSALALASQSGHAGEGIRMLLAYSLGLGVPFLISDRLKESFAVIKSHYGIINRVSGIFLVLVGILMATGTMGRLLSLLTV